MNNCLLAKSINTLEVSNLLLVGVLLYGTQQCPLRCLSFCGLWLAKRNRPVTLDKVAFLNKGFIYPLCSNETKSNAHLFISCRKSLQVWAHIRDLAPFREHFTSLQRITDSLIRGRSTSGIQGELRCLAIAITITASGYLGTS
ncbi:hypothetical protein HKD37_13G037647 [Glycine soja]